jgi:hypothetical protein
VAAKKKSPNWSAIGRRAKNKGKSYERNFAKILTEWTGVNFRKTPGSGGFNKQGVTVAGRSFAGDLICDKSNFIFSIEAKNRKNFSFQQILKNPSTAPFTEWWFQTVRDAKKEDLEPLLRFKPKEGSPDNLIALDISWASRFDGRAMTLSMYSQILEFVVQEKAYWLGEKRNLKHNVMARLPIPIIVHEKHFKEVINPDSLFGVADHEIAVFDLIEYSPGYSKIPGDA